MTKKTTERVELPESLVAFARPRLYDIIRASMWSENIIDTIALSCYFQGCNDVLQLIEQRPGFLDEYRAIQKEEKRD